MSGRSGKSSRSGRRRDIMSEFAALSIGSKTDDVGGSRGGVNNGVFGTPTSVQPKVSMSGTTLLYQYKRNVTIPTALATPLPQREFDIRHRSIKLGLGSAVGNLKTTHIVNGKKESLVNNTRRTFVRGSQNQSQQKGQNGKGDGITTPRPKLLTIYESPKSSGDFRTKLKEKGTSCRLNPSESVTGKVFITLNKKANYIASLGRKITFTLKDGINIEVNPTRTWPPEDENLRTISSLTKHFRNILGWKLGIHMSWKLVEERTKYWYSSECQPEPVSLEQIAQVLKVPVEKVEMLEFDEEMEMVFNVLRKNRCHINLPNYARLLGLQKIQRGRPEQASRYFSEVCGFYLQSEIVDKHLTFIRRSEETKSDGNGNEHAKHDIFWQQVNNTIGFSNSCFSKMGEEDFRKLSTFDPEWNIIQITSAMRCANRFGYDATDKQPVPELILTALGFHPLGEMNFTRSEFTTVCLGPRVDPGSQMRHGLGEAFEKLLDQNLMISDDKLIVSRKKYWEERGRHNDTIQAIMSAMEDWIFPWTFLLAGRLQDKSVRRKIAQEILSHRLLAKCSDTQKFVIYRLTEGFNLVPLLYRSVIDSLVAYILGSQSEDEVLPLCKLIREIGSSISSDEPRQPTILLLDQDIDILPWDWLPCLSSTTSVTRMPSLNLIHTTQLFMELVGGNQNMRSIDKNKCTFVLNPDGSLPQVQMRLENYLKDRTCWTPIIGRSPSSEEMQICLENQDIFLYCGHGSGSNFYPEYAVQKLICRAIPILMGCSSAQSHFSGPGLYSHSSVHSYFIGGSTSIVGFLWEVTDTECDRITADFLQRWLPHPSARLPTMPLFDSESKREHEPNLSSAWKKSRTAASQFLTQCAAVCYGLPIVRID